MICSRIRKKELVRFLFGGGSAVIVDFISYQWMLYLGLHMSLSKALSFMLGSCVGFIINKLWTFESRRFLKSEIWRYCILYLCTAMINAFINRAVVSMLQIQIIGFLCATGVSTVLNFLGQKYFVFRR